MTPTPPPPGEKSLADTPVAVDAGANQGFEPPRHQWRFAVELGADLLNRNLSYGNVPAGSILRRTSEISPLNDATVSTRSFNSGNDSPALRTAPRVCSIDSR